MYCYLGLDCYSDGEVFHVEAQLYQFRDGVAYRMPIQSLLLRVLIPVLDFLFSLLRG